MALPTLIDLKDRVGIDRDATDADNLLNPILAAATQWLRGRVGVPFMVPAASQIFIDRAETMRTWDAPKSLIIPMHPVDPTTVVITDAGGNVVDATSYYVDALTGIIYGNQGVSFPQGPYTIVCKCSLAKHPRLDYATEIEPVLAAAIIDLAAHVYQKRDAGAQAENEGGSSASWVIEPSGIPPRIKAMVERFRVRFVA